jgi:hypothetical protein
MNSCKLALPRGIEIAPGEFAFTKNATRDHCERAARLAMQRIASRKGRLKEGAVADLWSADDVCLVLFGEHAVRKEEVESLLDFLVRRAEADLEAIYADGVRIDKGGAA